MKEIKGDIFKPLDNTDAICIPTNGMVKKNGHAVMGKGVALEAVNRYPGIDIVLGQQLKVRGNMVNKIHTIMVSRKFTMILSFPTKHDWKDKSDLNLVLLSARQLVEIADHFKWKNVWLPRVGCGLGGLSWPIVKEELSKVLDDRFYIVGK